jgi:hypothetical protein
MPINLLADDTQEPVNLLADDNEDQGTVDTFIGRLPKNVPELRPGTPQNKELIENMMGAAIGGPGMKMIGAGIGKGANALKNMITSAGKGVEPYKNVAANAGQEYEAATAAAKVPKPGLYRNPMSDLEGIEHQLGTHINAEAEHGVRAAEGINSRVKSIEDFWSDSYKKLEDKIKDAKFHMPEQAMENLTYDSKAIMERIKQGADPKKVISIMEKEAANAKNPFYKQLIEKAPTSKDTNAGDFMAKYRDFRDTMGGLKSDLRNENILSAQKEKIREAIKKGKDMETQIKDTLHQGLGEHKPEFDWINKGYSEQVYPLRGNSLVNKVKPEALGGQGKIEDNLIKALRTNESGMGVLRDIVKQDPELLRNVVGQRYMAKPSSIHAPNELTREFLDEMPEFKNLLGKREEILENAVKRKDISLKNKIEAEAKLREIKNAKSKAKKNLWIGAGVGGSAIGIPYGYGKLSKLLMGDES